jgi:hypothetical protein
MNKFQYTLMGAATAIVVMAGLSFALNTSVPVQEEEVVKKGHRIVFQMSTPDTAAHRALTRQLNNLRGFWPEAQIEVVVHNKGIAMLLKEKTNIQPEITALKAKGVTFLACENTMKQQKLDKSQIISESGFVPGGLVQIVTRQEQGWSYIKGGF